MVPARSLSRRYDDTQVIVNRVSPKDRPNVAGLRSDSGPTQDVPPNPLGFHPVTVKRIAGSRLRIGPIEAIDGTPVVDIKPSLGRRPRTVK